MKRLILKPKSSFSNPIQSDTLFGMLCWVLRYDKGEQTLIEFLQECQKGRAMVFSNAFPKDCLPFPLLPIRQFSPSKDIDIKSIKKKNFIKKDLLQNKINNVISQKTIKLLFEVSRSIPQEANEPTPHNTIDRLTSSTLRRGGLFFSDERFFAENHLLDLYFQNNSILDDNTVIDYVEAIGKAGYGKDASTGKGQFIVTEKNDIEFSYSDCNAFMSLSLGILSETDPRNGYYKLHTKYPKTGISNDKAVNEIPFKKPIAMIKEGSIFYDNPVKEIYGTIISNIHADPRIVHNGQILAYPLTVKEDAK